MQIEKWSFGLKLNIPTSVIETIPFPRNTYSNLISQIYRTEYEEKNEN